MSQARSAVGSLPVFEKKQQVNFADSQREEELKKKKKNFLPRASCLCVWVRAEESVSEA